MSEPPETEPEAPAPNARKHAAWWNESQRRALLVILTGLFVLLAYRYATNPRFVDDPQPDPPPRYDELSDRIDPNNANWQTLAALPNLGEKRAKAVVAYREARGAGTVFKTADDLLAVRGIGAAMVTKLKPYLIFPADAPAPPTRLPATRRS